jgi:hypothetical protein
MRKNIVLFILTILSANIYTKELSGLILSGIDTFLTKNQLGFDFVTQENCTTFVNIAPYTCVDHFRIFLNTYTLKYVVDVPLGYSIKMGKINLDSIKSAPQDSVFNKQQIGQVDSIPVDSLSSRVGSIYLMKTGPDPRDKYPYYAKLKIIRFVVVDSAAHQIKMVFLWAANISGQHDLTTSGLDTFHLEPPTINQPNTLFVKGVNHAARNQYIFKVVGDKFIVPQELVGKIKWLTMWNMKGRKLGRIGIENQKEIGVMRVTKSKGVLVGRLE